MEEKRSASPLLCSSHSGPARAAVNVMVQVIRRENYKLRMPSLSWLGLIDISPHIPDSRSPNYSMHARNLSEPRERESRNLVRNTCSLLLPGQLLLGVLDPSETR